MPKQKNATAAAETPCTANTAESIGTFTKRIGNTTYTVNVYSNPNSKETFNDKLLRIIKNDIASGKFTTAAEQ